MTALLIIVVSFAALAHFFLYYCQTILRATLDIQVSQHVRTLSGMEFGRPAMDSFSRLVLLIRLCPPLTAERTRELRFVRLYCALLRLAGLAVPPVLGRGRRWMRSEAGACAHFAAVALDERISRMRQFYEHSFANPARH